MADKTLQETVESIRALRSDAALPVEQWDPRTRPGIEQRKRAAEEALPEATRAYKSLLASRLLIVNATGPYAKGFAEIAEAEFGCLALPADALYRDAAAFVRSMVPNGELFSASAVMGLKTFLRDFAFEMGWDRIVAPVMDNDLLRQVDGDETLVELVRQAIDRGPGPAVNQAYVANLATGRAAASEYVLPILPVVLFAEAPAPVFTFERQMELVVDKNVGRRDVEEGLEAVRRQFGIGGPRPCAKAPAKAPQAAAAAAKPRRSHHKKSPAATAEGTQKPHEGDTN